MILKIDKSFEKDFKKARNEKLSLKLLATEGTGHTDQTD